MTKMKRSIAGYRTASWTACGIYQDSDIHQIKYSIIEFFVINGRFLKYKPHENKIYLSAV